MANELAIIRPENISEIAAGASTAYGENETSLKRCSDCGEDLLRRIREGGMTPELDAEAANFIERARKTLKKMNEKRTGITRLFDGVKTAFTTLENAVDPAKKDTVAWRVQQERNAYAAARREEEQRRQREEAERQRRERAEAELRANVERTIRREMSAYVKKQCDALQGAFNYATLDNFDATVNSVRSFAAAVPSEFAERAWLEVKASCTGVPEETLVSVCNETMERLRPNFESYYAQETETLRAELLEKFPSKKAQLLKAAQASEAEAERIRRQMEEADRAAAQRREQERLQKEERERQEAALAAKQAEAASLFSQAAAQQETYVPKTKVTKRIELLNPEGILPVISFWFSREGCKLSTEELAKMFRKQITYAEKIANCANPELIRDESVAYADEVKAR